jgi:hypothetical protein
MNLNMKNKRDLKLHGVQQDKALYMMEVIYQHQIKIREMHFQMQRTSLKHLLMILGKEIT